MELILLGAQLLPRQRWVASSYSIIARTLCSAFTNTANRWLGLSLILPGISVPNTLILVRYSFIARDNTWQYQPFLCNNRPTTGTLQHLGNSPPLLRPNKENPNNVFLPFLSISNASLPSQLWCSTQRFYLIRCRIYRALKTLYLHVTFDLTTGEDRPRWRD